MNGLNGLNGLCEPLTVKIVIPYGEIEQAILEAGLNPDDPEDREKCEQVIHMGIEDHIRLRDWSLSDLLKGVK